MNIPIQQRAAILLKRIQFANPSRSGGSAGGTEPAETTQLIEEQASYVQQYLQPAVKAISNLQLRFWMSNKHYAPFVGTRIGRQVVDSLQEAFHATNRVRDLIKKMAQGYR